MLNMKIETLVNQIVRQELVGKGNEDALYFNFDLRLDYITDEGSYKVSKGLHLLYHVKPGYSYITVFSGLTDSPFDSIKKVESWKHETTHDSCWRDIGVFSSAYFNMANRINECLMIDGKKEVAPKDMHEFNSFNGFDKAFSWQKVEIITDPDDVNRYRKLLKLL